MKNLIFVLILLILPTLLFGQMVVKNKDNQVVMVITQNGKMGIGTSEPAASAILEIQSTTKGFRLPVMTTAERNAISQPVEGLTIYNKESKQIEVYSGSAWKKI